MSHHFKIILGIVAVAVLGTAGYLSLTKPAQTPIVQTPSISPDSNVIKNSQEVQVIPKKEEDNKVQEQIYTNAQYGFQLTLPETWKGYKVVEEKGGASFLMPISGKENEYKELFGINIYTLAQWQNAKASATAKGLVLIAQGDKYAYAYFLTKDTVSTDLKAAAADVTKIIKSFELTK